MIEETIASLKASGHIGEKDIVVVCMDASSAAGLIVGILVAGLFGSVFGGLLGGIFGVLLGGLVGAAVGSAFGSIMKYTSVKRANNYILSAGKEEVTFFDIDKETYAFLGTCTRIPRADIIYGNITGMFEKTIKLQLPDKIVRFTTGNTFKRNQKKEVNDLLLYFFARNKI